VNSSIGDNQLDNLPVYNLQQPKKMRGSVCEGRLLLTW